jgi:hypothetical protein
MRNSRHIFILALLLFLCAFTARGQKLDRGIDMSTQPCFIEKGTWMVGGGASYMLHNNDNSRLLVVNGIKSTGYTISVSPAFCYMVKDNMGVGVRFGYKRNMLQLDSAKMTFDDIDLSVANFHKISHAFEIQGIGRYYIPVGSLKRIGLFNELQLAYSYGQGKVLDGHGDKVDASYEISNSLGINVCPGFMAFVTEKLAIDVSVNMLGLQFDWTHQTHNQVEEGSRGTSLVNFKVNLLAIGFSLYYYL